MMKENKYDDPGFYRQYSSMARSTEGLEAAGEWYVLKGMLPDFTGKRVLDLGCGFGWHCRYAMENGAQSAIGIDISEKMLDKAREINSLPGIEYIRMPLEDIDFPAGSFDTVISSLTLHYIEPFADICREVYDSLAPGGSFVFSVEHPVFTAYGDQQWFTDAGGGRLHWPVDRYFTEGSRGATFLGEKIVKYHRTLETYLNELLRCGFNINQIAEPAPSPGMLEKYPEMADEARRPMMLLVAATKGKE